MMNAFLTEKTFKKGVSVISFVIQSFLFLIRNNQTSKTELPQTIQIQQRNTRRFMGRVDKTSS